MTMLSTCSISSNDN